MIQSVTLPKRGGRRLENDPEVSPLSTTPSHLNDDVAEDLVQCFKLFADETRVRILHYLMQHQEMHVGALCRLLKQSQPAVSHHLALLRVAGFIDSRRDGKHNFYHLAPKRFHELLRTLFGTEPSGGKLPVFDNYVLSYGKSPKSGV